MLTSFDLSLDLTTVSDALRVALEQRDDSALTSLAAVGPVGRRDRFAVLLQIYALHTAPVETLADAVRYQGHPAVAELKWRCETDWLAELSDIGADDGLPETDAVSAMRALAARDRLPEVYKWLAHEASWDDVVTFLALEGGPDAGFDDLVALCQVGLSGAAKLELARNYWDEMGNGDEHDVHTSLHGQLASAIDLPSLPLDGQPTSALERAALGGLLSTTRWLQPEALGALGLIELQAGPRCRLVLQAFERCGAPEAAYPFYEVHATVDPRHGRDWLDNAIVPICAANPTWASRVVRGARWRSAINARFLADAERLLRPT